MTLPATDGNTIDSIINSVDQLYKDFQLEDACQYINEGDMEKLQLAPKSSGGESLEGKNIGGSGGTYVERVKSAPPQNLPDSLDMIRKLHGAIHRLKLNLKFIEGLQLHVETELKEHYDSLKKKVAESLEPSGNSRVTLTSSISDEVEKMTKKILELINKVRVIQDKQENTTVPDSSERIVFLPAIYECVKDLKNVEIFRKVRDEFEKLATCHQICLLSFAMFPENQEVNRTMLMYWWIGEGILPHEMKPEVAVKNILKELTDKKLIEPVDNKRRAEPSSYKMTPFVHSSVVLLSKEMGLFDMYDTEHMPTMKQSKLNKVCLVERSSSLSKAIDDIDLIETVFNVSEKFPDFTSKWFSSMKVLKVLYLGKWERAEGKIVERDIQVDNRRIMKKLSCVRKLRFLSFQGILTIKSLSRSVCELTELVILDLRGCKNLVKLPEKIYKLKNLVHLDLTGCDALERIPWDFSRLTNLEVLKGFVVADVREYSCRLNSLKMKKLRKLSVTVDRECFGFHELVTSIEGLTVLEKLKVRWRSRIPKNHEDNNLPALPKSLRKLDLQCFPDIKWLQHQNLMHLEKLYLGSSRCLEGFRNLPITETSCSVTTLRLTCLPNLRVEWRDLLNIFPNMTFLESYKCPRVTFCPCDRDGIWRKSESE